MTVSVENVEKLLAHEPSLGVRLGHAALLVAAGSAAALTAQLWLTEPSLPVRTHSAFGAIVIGGASWAAYAWWALTNGRFLPATQRIISSRLAAACSTLFFVGAVILRDWVGPGGVLVSTTFFGIACVNLVAARRRFTRLAERGGSLTQGAGK